MLHILGTIIIGFIAGVIAKLITPGDREPKGFILTTILGSSLRRTSGKRWVGMDPTKIPDLSVPSWAP